MPLPIEHTAKVKKSNLFKKDTICRKVIQKGVSTIIGRLKDTDEIDIYMYRFNTLDFTDNEAIRWLNDNKINTIEFTASTDSTIENNRNSTNNESERRIVDNIKCKYESRILEDETKQDYISGIGVVYNTEVEIWPGFYEKILPGAFTRSLLKYNEIKSFINHDPSLILSTTKSNPALELTDNEHYLHFLSPIAPTTYGKDLAINVDRGNISGASFSFRINEEGERYTIDEDDNYHREIIDAELYEVGPVTNPAYQQTAVALRSKETILPKLNELRKHSLNDTSELDIINKFLLLRKGY